MKTAIRVGLLGLGLGLVSANAQSCPGGSQLMDSWAGGVYCALGYYSTPNANQVWSCGLIPFCPGWSRLTIFENAQNTAYEVWNQNGPVGEIYIVNTAFAIKPAHALRETWGQGAQFESGRPRPIEPSTHPDWPARMAALPSLPSFVRTSTSIGVEMTRLAPRQHVPVDVDRRLGMWFQDSRSE
jgi:hypothetical protein